MISPFTPLFFNEYASDGIPSDYMQTFATTDRILIESIDTSDNLLRVVIADAHTGEPVDNLNLNVWKMNDDTYLHFVELSLPAGCYSVYISGVGYSHPFRVTDDEKELENTVLIQYSNRDNRQRKDAVFLIDHMRHFFDFRVHGGFKDSQWEFSAETEQFVTQYADINQLYGLDSIQKQFTLGQSSGVPVWFGAMLNRILSCSHVYFDGVKYCRKESSVPEISQPFEGVDSFVFTQTLQQSIYLDPVIEDQNAVAMRRIGNDYRAISTNINRIIY